MNMKVLKSSFFVVALLFLAVSSTGAYFSDVAVVDGNKFSTATWNKIVINEIYYHGTEEWVELYNSGTVIVDIKGWTICDNANHCGSLNPAKKTEVAPGGYVVISHDANDLDDWTIPATAAKINYAGSKIAFNDTGDSVILKDAAGKVVDQMSYGNDLSVFNPSCDLVNDDQSIVRKTPGLDTDTVLDFIDNLTPTPGA